jgi:hypothetical protein
MRIQIFPALIISLLAGSHGTARSSSGGQSLGYCELVENASKYSGSRVTVMAVYNYGYEWQEMLCMECRADGKTWLEFNTDAAKRIKKQMKKAPQGQGIVSGRFTGVFHATGGPYGDGSYKFEFEVEEVSDLRVLVRDWKSPLDRVGSCKSIFSKRIR